MAAARWVRESFAGAVSAGLAREVLARLHELELVAAGAPTSRARVARVRERLRVLLTKWSRMLDAHTADEGGRCPLCRTWWHGRRRWPCGVWQAAQSNLAAHTNLVRYEIPAPTDSDPASPTVRPGFSILGRRLEAGVELQKLAAVGMTTADLSAAERGTVVYPAGDGQDTLRA